MRKRVVVVGAAVLMALAGCAPSVSAVVNASSSTNNGVIPIAQAATYTYKLTGNCINDPMQPGQTTISFRLMSDSGAIDWIAPSGGTLYLTPGNWTGEDGTAIPTFPTINVPAKFVPMACSWTLTLTP